MVTMVRVFLSIRWIFSGGVILLGALNLVFPEQLVSRAYLLAEAPTANIWLIQALGVALIGTGLALLTDPRSDTAPPSWALLLITGVTVCYFLVLGLHLQDWWIDDAGITFAYSRSLADGLGLVAQPWLPAEEGYSSSTWMLLLSFAARLGADIPIAAKYLGIGCSVLCICICAWIVARETRSPLALLICGIGIATGPTVVWAVSGQEHALQALILLLAVLCVYLFEHWRWPVAVILSVFVLTRPEAPIIVIGVFCAAVFLTRRRGGRLINAADIAVALVPFLSFLALIAFRMAYFGDPMPNPFYAKSSGTGLTGLFNPLGGGWAYILSGLRDTALLSVLGLAFVIRTRPLPSWIIVAIAILLAHVFFVIWAKGDWMGQYRFLMPVLPIALLVASLGLRGLSSYAVRAGFSTVAVLIVLHTTALQLAGFKASPTTPLAAVVAVGNTFQTLSERLEIEDPLLAHHDAGGIAYHRMIRLADLGGLINRTIAKNMDDKAFLTTYLLEDVQPDFFFGGRNFAAASGFSDTEAFAADYAPLEFIDMPHMRSDLAYIRRSRVREAQGVEPVYDDKGALASVRIDIQ
ncbi:hypothetical protein [uncultured Roseobacter sp.]|uniref:hypothetical protein n=1 Tax=uncultured Roseobacter sp. TaxID=114847 RepID=UPI00261B0143|nr:hypothetical protein [uncultured Roseobacter sp.]